MPLLDLDDEVALSSYRNEKTFSGSAALSDGDTKVLTGATEVGTGTTKENKSPLSKIIETINSRFGTDWTEEDRLLFDQISGDMISNEKLNQQARVNSGTVPTGI